MFITWPLGMAPYLFAASFNLPPNHRHELTSCHHGTRSESRTVKFVMVQPLRLWRSSTCGFRIGTCTELQARMLAKSPSAATRQQSIWEFDLHENLIRPPIAACVMGMSGRILYLNDNPSKKTRRRLPRTDKAAAHSERTRGPCCGIGIRPQESTHAGFHESADRAGNSFRAVQIPTMLVPGPKRACRAVVKADLGWEAPDPMMKRITSDTSEKMRSGSKAP